MNNNQVHLTHVVNDRLLIIADYQRPYAWRERHLKDLWEDLDLLGPQAKHYAGTLVLRDVHEESGPVTSMADDGSTLQHCEVVDGQQRLTTCFLLLDRMRRRFEELGEAGVEHAASVAQNLRGRFGMVSVGNLGQPRLRLGAGLNDFWFQTILGDQHHDQGELIAGQRRLRDAAAYFDQLLLTLSQDGPEIEFDRLRDLQGRVTAGLSFLVHEVSSAAEVGVIFETLNGRGQRLSDLELTKNYLLYLSRQLNQAAATELSKRINKAWSSIFANLSGLGSDAEEQLLRAHWLATQNPRTRDWKRVESIKKRFDRARYVTGAQRLLPVQSGDEEDTGTLLYNELAEYVRTLEACSYYFKEMTDPSATYPGFPEDERDEVRRASQALLRSGVTAIYRPLLCAARLRHPQDGVFYAQLLSVCESYSARVFVIERRRANAGEARLLSLAHQLFMSPDDDDHRQWVLQEVAATLWRYASDEEVRSTLESTKENWYARRGHKYFLYEYEISRCKHPQNLKPLSELTTGSGEQRTTEHILPQNPAPATDDDVGCWWKRFTKEEHAEFRHALGNLVLTYDNSSYSNKCFAQKLGSTVEVGGSIRCYVQAELKQERELAGYPDWTPDTLRQRQQLLADWAMKRWAVEPPTTEELLEDDEIEQEEPSDLIESLDEDAESA